MSGRSGAARRLDHGFGGRAIGKDDLVACEERMDVGDRAGGFIGRDSGQSAEVPGGHENLGAAEDPPGDPRAHEDAVFAASPIA